MNDDVARFIEKWAQTGASERANFQPFCDDLCDLLGVGRPHGSQPDESANAYVFEKSVPLHQPDGSQTTGRIDLYMRGHFVIEGKQGAEEGAAKKGHGTRGTAGWDKAMVRAKKQAENYIHALPSSEGRPPFLIVVDVGHSIELYSEFTRTGGIYVPYPDPRSHRIFLKDLAKEDVRETLRSIWTEPLALDPSRRAAQVTREIADQLAKLAKSLEASGHSPAASGGFLMRCIFTMFAEDVNLLPKDSFEQLLRSVRDQPAQFVPLVKSVWDGMNDGGFCVALRHTLLKFNGGLFEERNPLPVTSEQIDLLIEAARADWREVEPAIFGTLLERALDPRERHKLGAHYTPRDYVERLVMPTVIEPLREQWDNVQAAVARHLQDGNESKGRREAVKELEAFLDRLCKTRVLDPACGSGNFLYVTMEHMKRLEGEVLDLLLSLGQERLELEGHTVHPSQFLGIEINPRAAVLAELCLWIGYLQWHFRTRGEVNPPEPVISKFHTIECRDAVLAYDSMTPRKVAAASSRSVENNQTKRLEAAATVNLAAKYAYYNPYKKVDISKAHLPHWRQEDVTYFVTFRLADSLPQQKLDAWKAERDSWLASNPKPHTEEQKSDYFVRFSSKMEAWLDAGHGDCILADKACKTIVEDAIRHFDGKRYELGEYTVASNHVHALVTPKQGHELSEIVHSWKSYTANELNKQLGRSGQVWQKEYYDHILRSASAAYRIEQYIKRHVAMATASSRSPDQTERQDAAATEHLEFVTRWDGHTMKSHPVTGKPVPDESATIPVYQYENPRPAEWPEADYIVGNPPFIGTARMRDALGDGYVDILRRQYPIPESVDFVMFWWHKAAELARAGKIRRFGLITTNSLRQTFNRRVLQLHLNPVEAASSRSPDKKRQDAASTPLSLRFAIPDHPWVENADGAAVRIAMTVAEPGNHEGTLATVVDEAESDDGSVAVELLEKTGLLHADLTIGPNLAAAGPLLANAEISCPGVKLHGSGFIVEPEDLDSLGYGTHPGSEQVIRHYRNGKDLTQRPRGVLVIDLFGLSAEEVRERYPEIYQWVHDRVKPERDQNKRESYKKNWWIHGEPRKAFRPALHGLPRYIATVETAKHRFFQFLDASILPDNMLVCIASDQAWALGILSSKVHVTWALAVGGRLGVGNDPRYNKTRCFETFPFPELDEAQKTGIGRIAEALDAHRKARLEAHPKLTMTGLYNVLEKLKVAAASSRSGSADERQDAAATDSILTPKEKTIYEDGLVGVLRELHDDLDAAVLAAYGWPIDLDEEELLTRLVALNQQRAAEEAKGRVRYLRPEYQNPEANESTEEQTELETTQIADPASRIPHPAKQPWPKTVAEQAAAVRTLIRQTGWTSEQDIQLLAQHFKGVRAPKVQAIAEALIALGQAA